MKKALLGFLALLALIAYVHRQGRNESPSPNAAEAVETTPAETVTAAPAPSSTPVAPLETSQAAPPPAPAPFAGKESEATDSDLEEDEAALYGELSNIADRMDHDLRSGEGDIPVEAESDLMGFQAELLQSAQSSRQEAEFAARLLERCGRDPRFNQDVRLSCAQNFKRLAALFPELMQGSSHQDFLNSLSPDDVRERTPETDIQ